MWRLERVVGSPQVGLRVNHSFWGKPGGAAATGMDAIDIGWRNRVDAGDSRQGFSALVTPKVQTSVLNRGGKPEAPI